MQAKVTLSRVQKLVARLNEEIQARMVAMQKNIVTNVDAPFQLSPEKQDNQVKQYEQALAEYVNLNETRRKLRDMVAVQNVKLGINELLSHQEEVNGKYRHMVSLRDTIAGTHSLESLKARKEAYENRKDGSNVRLEMAIQVAIFTPEKLKELDTQIENCRKEGRRLADKIADKNAHRVAIEIDDGVGELLGL